MPRTAAANQRIREEQREKILEAAQRVFARKGLAATMADVASEANVSQGLAYRYFASKEALVFELVTQALHAPAAGLHQHLQAPGTPGARLKVLVRGFVESRRHPEFYLLLDHVLGSGDTPDALRALVRRRSQEMQDVLRHLIVEAQATGEVAAGDPDQLVCAIFACSDGLLRWAAHHPDLYQEHFPDAAIFLRMLTPERTLNLEDME
jgi:AcrR family transcriptional regulator